MQRKIVFRFEPSVSTPEQSTWAVSRNRLPESASESTLFWQAQPVPTLLQSRKIDLQQTEFVLMWHDREEEHHDFVFMEFELYESTGTCWKQDYRLDRVLESMCQHMKLPGSQLELSNFLFDWLFYPKSRAQVLSQFEPEGSRL
jgi:hypothetical protein